MSKNVLAPWFRDRCQAEAAGKDAVERFRRWPQRTSHCDEMQKKSSVEQSQAPALAKLLGVLRGAVHLPLPFLSFAGSLDLVQPPSLQGEHVGPRRETMKTNTWVPGGRPRRRNTLFDVAAWIFFAASALLFGRGVGGGHGAGRAETTPI